MMSRSDPGRYLRRVGRKTTFAKYTTRNFSNYRPLDLQLQCKLPHGSLARTEPIRYCLWLDVAFTIKPIAGSQCAMWTKLLSTSCVSAPVLERIDAHRRPLLGDSMTVRSLARLFEVFGRIRHCSETQRKSSSAFPRQLVCGNDWTSLWRALRIRWPYLLSRMSWRFLNLLLVLMFNF